MFSKDELSQYRTYHDLTRYGSLASQHVLLDFLWALVQPHSPYKIISGFSQKLHWPKSCGSLVLLYGACDHSRKIGFIKQLRSKTFKSFPNFGLSLNAVFNSVFNLSWLTRSSRTFSTASCITLQISSRVLIIGDCMSWSRVSLMRLIISTAISSLFCRFILAVKMFCISLRVMATSWTIFLSMILSYSFSHRSFLSDFEQQVPGAQRL